MKNFVGSRGIGKTTELINYAVDNNCMIFSFNEEKMRRKVISMGYNPSMVCECDINSFVKLMESNKNFVIDDIDKFLETVYKNKILGFTLTVD